MIHWSSRGKDNSTRQGIYQPSGDGPSDDDDDDDDDAILGDSDLDTEK